MTGRSVVFAGNWKMNHTPEDATRFFASFLEAHQARSEAAVIFFPTALAFAAAKAAVAAREDVHLGVQNIHWEESGAFTGEISAPQAAAAGATHVLVGHSERRHIFGETAEETARKVAAALEAGLRPILCVGETLDQRETGRAESVVNRQLAAVFDTLDNGAAARVWIAYEPVWAIGTGRTASPADAADMHGRIRADLRGRLGAPAAETPILYGGSVKPENAAELLGASDVDGLLVGGASLDPAAFARICAARAA